MIEEFRTKELALNNKLSQYQNENSSLEVKLKVEMESYRNTITKYENDRAVDKQTNEFQELKLKELRTQLEDQKKNYDSLLMTLDNKYLSMGESNKDYQLKLEELKDVYENDKKIVLESFNKTKELYLQQVSKR